MTSRFHLGIQQRLPSRFAAEGTGETNGTDYATIALIFYIFSYPEPFAES